MSLITDLLSKVKQQDPKRDIPPLLKDSIMQGASQRQSRSKIMIPLVALLIVVAGGVVALYLTDIFKKDISNPSIAMKPVSGHPVPQKVVEPVVTQSIPVVSTLPLQVVQEERTHTDSRTESQKSDIALQTPRKKSEKKYVKKIMQGSVSELKEAKQGKASRMDRKDRDEETKKISRQDKDLYLYMARTYEREKNYQQALSYYKNVLTIDPRNYMVMNNISSALIQMGSYDEAIRYAEKALQIRKDYVPSLINLGISYSQLGKFREGDEYLKRALIFEASNRFALFNIGLLYEKRDMFDKSRDFYLRLSDSGDSRGYIGLARIAEKQGKSAEAINYYKAAMSIESRDSQTWNFANDRLSQLIK